MIFETKPGSKNGNPKDKILLSKCPMCGYKEALLLKDLLRWIRFKGHIEDLHYPTENGFRGRWFLLDFIGDGLKKKGELYLYTISEVCKKYKIPEKD